MLQWISPDGVSIWCDKALAGFYGLCCGYILSPDKIWSLQYFKWGKMFNGLVLCLFFPFLFPLGRKCCAGWDLQSSTLKGMFSKAFWQVHFSWKADHLLLHGYFILKYPLLFNWANPTTQTFLPSPLLPSSLQSEWLRRPEWFQLKDSQVAGTPPDDMYHPLEPLSLSLDSQKRHLDSFKWGQQTSRLPTQDRSDTVEISTVCGEKWKCNHAIATLSSDFQSKLKIYLVAHFKI